MTLKELLDYSRRQLDDTKTPYLWSKADLVLWLNEAEREAARRARLLVDSRTAEVCELTVVADEPYLTLDPRVLFVRRARLASVSWYLKKFDVRDLDECRPGWESETGDVWGYVQNEDSRHLRLVGTPTASDTLKITVSRLPLVEMAADTDEPEIRSPYHLNLHHWVLWRAYSVDDTDLRDDEKAARNLALFEAEFGRRSTAIDEQWTREHHGYNSMEGERL